MRARLTLAKQFELDAIRRRFGGLQARVDVAALLEIPDTKLCDILYGYRGRCRYKKFDIPKKSGGTRSISAPPKQLLILQRTLADVLQIVYRPKPSVHGFLRHRGILSNASPHIGKRYVLNIDLKDFFPTIHLGRLRGALMAEPYKVGSEAALVLAQICCDNKGRLPQGAPTSPMASNIVCRPLDTALQRLAQQYCFTYTRYVDDITFSTTRTRLPQDLVICDERVLVGKLLQKTIRSHGFRVNSRKVWLRSTLQSQRVTGLVVNEFSNVPRKYIRDLRAMLHDWDKNGLEQAASRFADQYGTVNSSPHKFKRVVLGRLAFIRMVRGPHDPVYRKLRAKLHFIDKKVVRQLPRLVDINPTPLRGITNNLTDWAAIAARYEDGIFLLSATDNQKNVATGTAFAYKRNELATAGHNVDEKETVEVSLPGSDVFSPQTVLHRDVVEGADLAVLTLSKIHVGRLNSLPTQYRIPQVGEPVAALGYPKVPLRQPSLVTLVGNIAAIPTDYEKNTRFLQVSFDTGGGFSGAPLIDRRGFVVGIMVENVFEPAQDCIPAAQYSQALPIGYLHYLRKHDLIEHVPQPPADH